MTRHMGGRVTQQNALVSVNVAYIKKKKVIDAHQLDSARREKNNLVSIIE